MENQIKKGSIRIPVYYEDTDLSGNVFHANYLKFFERSRSELLGRKLLKKLFDEGRQFVVREMQVKYHKPARLGDLLLVKTEIHTENPVILHCHQEAFCEESGDLLVSGLIQLVMINDRGFPIRLPKGLFDPRHS